MMQKNVWMSSCVFRIGYKRNKIEVECRFSIVDLQIVSYLCPRIFAPGRVCELRGVPGGVEN